MNRIIYQAAAIFSLVSCGPQSTEIYKAQNVKNGSQNVNPPATNVGECENHNTNSLKIDSAGIVKSNVNLNVTDERMTSTALLFYPQFLPGGNVGIGSMCTAVMVINDPASNVAYAFTAAHCITQDAEIYMAAGNDITAITDMTRVVAKEFHPTWTGQGSVGDFGWVKLERPLNGVTATKVWADPNAIPASTDVHLVGFGQTKTTPNQNEQNTKKNVGKVQFTSYHTDPQVNHLMLFTSPTGTGACYGDSGGPAFIEKDGAQALIAVTHGVNALLIPEIADIGPSCETGKSLYTSVSPYLAWAEQTSGVKFPLWEAPKAVQNVNDPIDQPIDTPSNPVVDNGNDNPVADVNPDTGSAADASGAGNCAPKTYSLKAAFETFIHGTK